MRFGAALRAPRVASARARARARRPAALALRRALRRRRRRVREPAVVGRSEPAGHRWWLDVSRRLSWSRWTSAGLLRDLLATREHERVHVAAREGAARRRDGAHGRARRGRPALPRCSSSYSCDTSSAGTASSRQRVGLDVRRVRAPRLLRARRRRGARAAAGARVDAVVDGTRRQVRIVRGLAVTLVALVGIVWCRRSSGSGLPAAVRPDGAARLRDGRRALARRRLRLARGHGAARPSSPLRDGCESHSASPRRSCLNVLDPDALIARTNVARPQADVSYLASLSDDALPTLLARLPPLDPTLAGHLPCALEADERSREARSRGTCRAAAPRRCSPRTATSCAPSLVRVSRMSFDVRPCGDLSEYDGAFMSIGQYFGNEPDPERAERFSRMLPIERMHAAWEDGEIVGGAGGVPVRDVGARAGCCAAPARPSSASRRRIAGAACCAR